MTADILLSHNSKLIVMTNKNVFSFLCAIVVWILGVSFYSLSNYIKVIDNPELQANLFLVVGILPSALLGTHLFYEYSSRKPAVLALVFISVAALLDALITVPVFIIPNGGSYSAFFGDVMFYLVLVEFYLIVYVSGNFLAKKNKS